MKTRVIKLLQRIVKPLFWVILAILGVIILLSVIWSVLSGASKISIIDRIINSDSAIKHMSLLVYSKDGELLLEKNKGGMAQEDSFVIASISKLYTHAIIFRLIDEGLLSYDTPLSVILPEDELKDLHVVDGTQYGPKITIRQLIDQTSGLPDYETDKQANGTVLMDEIIKADKFIDYAKSLEITKSLAPKFTPGPKDKAYYSNMNANLLGRIAEIKTGKSLEGLFKQYIFNPLGLQNTSVANKNSEFRTIYFKNQELRRPEYVSSGIASGGIISNNKELMVFLRAFFNGKIFNQNHIENPTFRKIQWFPINYGSGLMKVEMSRALSPLFPAPRIIGHSGSTGSFAFYCPSKKMYITGALNQVNKKPYPIIYMYLSALK